MELITLTVTILGCIYIIFFSPRSIKALIQFFTLNLIISSFFLIGIALLLFGISDFGTLTLIPKNIEISFLRLNFY